MIARHCWIAVAALALASIGAPRHGMAQGTMKHDTSHGAMTHDTAATPSLASMLQRADSLVRQAERLVKATADTSAHGRMGHVAADSPQAMATSLHTIATGLRGALRHMDAMHRAGRKMEGDAGTAMMEAHQRMNAMLGELEQMLRVTDKMHAQHAKAKP